MTYAAKMRDAAPHLTKQQYVYEQLRADIIACRLAPGSRVRIDELAARFRVSIIPVREALRVLQSEGLVVTEPHVGVAISPIEANAITEALAIMEGLEVASARAAVENAVGADLADLDARVASMDRAVSEGRTEDWVAQNRRFHLAIARVAGMPLVQNMLVRAFDRWERVWRFYFEGVALQRMPVAQLEHQAMVRFIRARDTPALEETIRGHNRAALSAYLAEQDVRDRARAAD